MRPIERLAREQSYFAAVEPRLDAIAIELDLVNPFRRLRRSSFA